VASFHSIVHNYSPLSPSKSLSRSPHHLDPLHPLSRSTPSRRSDFSLTPAAPPTHRRSILHSHWYISFAFPPSDYLFSLSFVVLSFSTFVFPIFALQLSSLLLCIYDASASHAFVSLLGFLVHIQIQLSFSYFRLIQCFQYPMFEIPRFYSSHTGGKDEKQRAVRDASRNLVD
jgi:hypothetical protein